MANRATAPARGKRILALITDAYGGYGGIAAYSRDVLQAMCEDSRVATVIAVPRTAEPPITGVPDKLVFDLSATGGARAYVRALLRHLRSSGPFDLIYCAHINLVPLAWLASMILRKPWVLCIYGVEGWKKTGRNLPDLLAGKADHYLPLSQLTLDRFRKIWPVDPALCTVMHNAIHLEQFAPGPKDPVLSKELGIAGRTVLMTFGRMDPTEQAKGFDRMIRAIPRLIDKIPDVVYLICGKGDDRPHLERIAAETGVIDRVVFAGSIPEERKADYYRLADVYAMPSHGEGFGFVFLEAMACGIPAVASDIDGGREAVREGEIGWLVDPHDQDSIIAGIMSALEAGRRVPEGLAHFSYPKFRARLQAALAPLMGLDGADPAAGV